MRDPVAPLGNARFDGFCQIREIGPLGMISLRAKADVKSLAKAIKAAVGTKVPAARRIEMAGDRGCGWMSPDEYLLILPYGETGAAMAAIAKAMGDDHHLAAVVSDARAVFRVEGAKADQVLPKQHERGGDSAGLWLYQSLHSGIGRAVISGVQCRWHKQQEYRHAPVGCEIAA